MLGNCLGTPTPGKEISVQKNFSARKVPCKEFSLSPPRTSHTKFQGKPSVGKFQCREISLQGNWNGTDQLLVPWTTSTVNEGGERLIFLLKVSLSLRFCLCSTLGSVLLKKATNSTGKTSQLVNRDSALRSIWPHIGGMCVVVAGLVGIFRCVVWSGCCNRIMHPHSLVCFFSYDSDNPRVEGDVGMAGVAIDTVEDMKVLLFASGHAFCRNSFTDSPTQ